jgi:hypothetical protein
LDKNNERPDWMTDLKHTDSHAKKMHVKEIYVIFIHLFDSGILLIIDSNRKNMLFNPRHFDDAREIFLRIRVCFLFNK